MFDDIRPYTDAEIPAAMQRIVTYPEFRVVCGYLFPEKPFEEVASVVVSCRNVEEFQVRFMMPVVEALMAKTTDGVTVEGMEKLDPAKAYLFVSNHRDIVLDAAFLQVLLRRAGLRTSETPSGRISCRAAWWWISASPTRCSGWSGRRRSPPRGRS